MLMRFKQLTLSLCIIGVSATSWAQTTLVKSQQNIEEYKLDNGFRVILAPNNKENKILINTIYLTGSLNDPQGKGGLAHLLEHLAFKGTQNVKGEEFQRRLDQYTLMTNASTDYYSTRYTNIVRPEKTALNEVLYLEAERMDKLVLQEKFVPSEIEIVKREGEIRMDQPFSVLMDQMWKSAYGNKYLGRSPIGDLSELKSINMSELNQFYRTWYAPNNAVMVISGKFDKADVLKTVDQYFSPIAAKAVPNQAQVPVLDSAKIQNRHFVVKKGSDLAKFHIYMNGRNTKIQPALVLAPLLYTMQPSGHLYQDMVETGTTTDVQSTTWLDQDFNLVYLGAIYAPNHDQKKVESALAAGVESGKPFTETELNRVKTLIKHSQEIMLTNAESVGDVLSDYVVSKHGNWDDYFADQQAIQKLNVDEVNRTLKEFLTSQHRIDGDILPTPEDQKKALQQEAEDKPKTLDQVDVQAEPLKDAKVYQQEVGTFLKASEQYARNNEKKIVRGKLKNGMRYALFPVATDDDRTYATITVDFGTEKSLFNQSSTIDLTSYLLLRGSDKYSLQDIADKSIEAGGAASATGDINGMTLNIQAKTEKFDEFFKFVLDVMKHPKFEQSQFDLIKSQSLSSLDRPYTEPDVVAGLTLSRLLEVYQPGDLRYHFEPDLAKQQLTGVTQAQVKQLYDQFFAMNHAQIAITGAFDKKKMQMLIQQEFGQWNGQQPYEKILDKHVDYPAQKLHVLSEQREFGKYQSILTMPVGLKHPDGAALILVDHILGNSKISSRLAK